MKNTKRILFVCTGNTCRSPMAEKLFNQMLDENGICDMIAASAGIYANEHSISDNARTVLQELDIDASNHIPSLLTVDLLEKADIVCAITDRHAEIIKQLYPNCTTQITVLGSGIADPYGGDIELYRMTRDSIAKELKEFYNQIT